LDTNADFNCPDFARTAPLPPKRRLHYRHWTREQMIDFFHEHTSEAERDVQVETDRYIVTPAQALGYKLGQLEIRRLRERARTQLGSHYDVRAFHDEMGCSGIF
jgi:uncharacterized protein (DUF885 family)